MTELIDEAKLSVGRAHEAYAEQPHLSTLELQFAQAYAAIIAQAEAARPHYVRIGSHTINLAHIAYVDFDGKDMDGNKIVEITFLACSSDAAMGLRFRKHEVEPVAAFLRQVLAPHTVAELDLPAPQPATPPTPDGYAFTVLEQY